MRLFIFVGFCFILLYYNLGKGIIILKKMLFVRKDIFLKNLVYLFK